jgi:hypothetical protein
VFNPLKTKNKTNVEAFSVSRHVLFEGSQASTTCVPGKMGVEHCCNDTETGKPTYSKEEPVWVPFCPPQISHGLTPD